MLERADIKLALDMLETLDLYNEQDIQREHVISILEDCGNEIAKQRDTIERMKNDVHSCGPSCTKAACVNRQLREQIEMLQEALVDLMSIVRIRQSATGSPFAREEIRFADKVLAKLEVK